MDLLLVLLSTIIFAIAILHVRLLTIDSPAGNAIVNLLIVSGIYALWSTKLNSIFIVAIFLIICWGIHKRRFKLAINILHIKTSINLIAANIIIFTLIYFRTGKLFIPNEDYIFYSRVASSNKNWGVENTGTFYNWLSETYPKVEVYHYLELWTATLGQTLNNQNITLNLFFFSFLLGAIISSIALLELLRLLFSGMTINQTTLLVALLFIPLLMFFSHPWDTISRSIEISNLPISGMSGFWAGLKHWYTMIPVISIFLYSRAPSSERFIIMILSGFIYYPLLPIILASTGAMLIAVKWRRAYILRSEFIYLLLTGGLIWLFYNVMHSGNGNVIVGVTVLEWLQLSHWLNYTPAIIMKTIMIPIIGFIPVIGAILLFKLFSLKMTFSYYYLGVYLIICIGIWMIFSLNIDANQSFLLIFSSLIPLLIIIGLVAILTSKYKVLGVLLVLVYSLPGAVNAYSKSIVQEEFNQQDLEVIRLLKNKRILYIPDSKEISNIYKFNERVYTGLNWLYQYNDKLEIASTSAAISVDTTIFNEITKAMYFHYRNISPFFQECGNIQLKDPCLFEFMRKHKIDLFCIKSNVSFSKSWTKIGSLTGYEIYSANMFVLD